MKCRLLTVFVLGFYFGMVQFASPMEPPLKIEEGKESLHIAGKYLDLKVSLSQPQFLRVTVDSLGSGRFPAGDLRSPPKVPRPTVVKRTNNKVEYRGRDQAPSAPGRWMFEFDEKTIRLVSRWSENDPPEPVVLDFDLKQCHATILGLVKSEGKMALPAVMHLPDQGSFRITTNSPAEATLDFDARRAIGPFAKISFPPATKETPQVEYRLEATAIYPKLAGIENDPRFNGFRRNWLNILQVNPRLGVFGQQFGQRCLRFLRHGICRHRLAYARTDRLAQGARPDSPNFGPLHRRAERLWHARMGHVRWRSRSH